MFLMDFTEGEIHLWLRLGIETILQHISDDADDLGGHVGRPE